MNVREIVKQLQEQGHFVRYIVRKDGGIRITKIDDRSFKGSEGNSVARFMLGEYLSERRSRQLHRIRSKEGEFGHKKKKDLDEDIKKEIRRVQRIWKKNKVREDDLNQGMPTIQNFRYVREHYGTEEAMRLLRESERYAKGLAYTERIDSLILQIRQIKMKLSAEKKDGEMSDQDYAEDIIQLLESKKETLKESGIKHILNALYNIEGKNATSIAEWHRITKIIIEKYS